MSFAGADVVIGLEVHCELDTKTKLFAAALARPVKTRSRTRAAALSASAIPGLSL